jgi:uncharacterized membrane protein YphA (DoxX/SURF4 family)
MRRSAALLRAVVVGSLVAGLALMIPFEATITRLLGVALLFAFIIGALFLIAEPKFLEGDRD